MVETRAWRGGVEPGKTGFSSGGPGLASALAALLILSGCSAASGPSEETAYLDRQVVPRIVKWGSGAAETFEFAPFAEARGYDKICLLDQYWSLVSIGDGFGPIDRYYSTFGNTVPENFMAVVAIRQRVAHAALLDSTKIELGVVPGKLCGSAKKTVLRRMAPPHEWSSPSAILEPVL